MNKMLWGGGFTHSPKKIINEYMSKENIQFDKDLIEYDILGSLAHIEMLKDQKILKKEEHREIKKALKKILKLHEKGKFILKEELEDVHMNIENEVTKYTVFGEKLHTARSRNDQILLDMRLYLRDELLKIADLIFELQKAFLKLGRKNMAMPAYTHTRIAQPITTCFWCQAYVQSFDRDLERIFDAYKRVNKNPLGACAVSGTSWNINREKTAQLLGFESILENEMDAINSRGEIEAEVIYILSQFNTKLSRFAEEIIWFSEKGMIKIKEEHTTGSSLMPNKKNPDVFELLRGRTARTYGSLIQVLSVQKGLISGYNSDVYETKYAIMNTIKHVKESISLLIVLVPALNFDEKRMEEEIKKGYANATELADLIAKKGVPFRKAHEKIGKLVVKLAKQGKYIENLNAKEISEMLKIKIEKKDLENAIGLKKKRFATKIKLNTEWKKLIEHKTNLIREKFKFLKK